MRRQQKVARGRVCISFRMASKFFLLESCIDGVDVKCSYPPDPSKTRVTNKFEVNQINTSHSIHQQ